MKFIALFCFIGFAAASSGFSALRWQSGEEYVFNYNGRMLTGLPELNSHYSGLGMRCQVHLQVQGENKFAIQVRNVEYSRVNKELSPSNDGHSPRTGPSTTGGFSGSFEESNWRNLELPSFVTVPTETAEYLRKTTLFNINEFGGVSEITLSKDEPEWSINFKKALVVLFQTKSRDNFNLESNSINGIEEEISRSEEERLNSRSQEGESPIFGSESAYWRTTEESVDGTCTVTYQLNELPKYMTKDVHNMVERTELCPEGKYFELTKSKDVSSCSTRSAFTYYKPGFFKCPAGNCDGMWSRSSITKYIACGSSKSDLKIMTIINDGELQQDLLGFNTERFLTGTSQVLKLVSKQSISQRFNTPSNPITISSLMYEYSLTKNLARSSSGSIVSEEEQYGYGMLEGLTKEEREKIEEEELYKFLPKHILTTGSKLSEGSQNVDEKLIPQVKTLLRELVVDDISKVSNNVPKKQITMKVLSLSRAFAIMSKSGIKSVYEELKSQFSGKEKTIFKNIFFDTVLMGGSVSDVLLIKEWILNGEVTSKVQIASLLTFLPQYVTLPTERVMSELFELIQSEKISGNFALYTHGLLGFTTLVERSCISTNSETAYPVNVFGSFCHADSDIVVGKLIPYLEHELKSTNSAEKKNLVVLTLGLLSHKRVVSILLPVIESTYTTTSAGQSGSGIGGVSEHTEEIESTGFTRYLAIYSLSKVGKQYPELVTPILMSVFMNKGETTEVRVAAFNCILNLQPSTAVLQQIGTSTWSETDVEVLKTVNTAFYSLMKVNDWEQVSTTSSSLSRKVALIYPLIKKTGGSLPTSASLFTTEYLRKLGVGYTSIKSWTSSSESFIPKNIYSKIVYYLDRYQFTPIEFGLRFQGVENIISVIRESVSTGNVESTSEIREEINNELKKIVEELKIKTRGTQSTQGAIYLSFMENLKTFISFDTISEEALKEKILPLIRNPERIVEKILGGEGSELLNFQRAMDLAMTEALIPSDMGLPIVIETHMPVVFSINGNLNLESSSAVFPSVNMKVKALFVAQYTGWVGTVCPFTQESLLTAVDQHTVINVPTEFTVGLNIPEGKLKVVIKPTESGISGPIDMLHYHIRPYTVRQNFWDLKPMTLSPNVKDIKSRTPLMEKITSFGEEYLGLNLKSVIRSESRFMDKASIIEKLSLFNFSPLNMVRFSWAPTALSQRGYPSLRFQESKIIFDKSESSTKEIEFNLRVGVATKEVGTGIMYHKLSVVEGLRSILPYKIHSESLESATGSHSDRSQKLQKAVEKLGELESATGCTLSYSLTLHGGSRPKTYSFTSTFVTGSNKISSGELKQKWNLHLESETSNKKICIHGDVDMPLVPVWELSKIRSSPFEYRYNNVIGFGSGSCEEHTIKISGKSYTSEEQKRYSRESVESRLLEKLRSEGRPVTELSELAQKVRNQASTLDVVEFRTEFHNVPSTVMKIGDFTVEFFKAMWWPYLEKVEGSSVSPSSGNISGSSIVKINFHPERETVDVTLHRPSPGNQVIVWRNIRMVTPLTYILPKVAGKPITKSLEQSIRGVSVYPTCKLEGDYMKTFKNKTVEAKIDSCFHLFAADCGLKKEFAILVRSLSTVSGPKEVKVLLETAKGSSKSILLTPTDSHSKQSGSIRVTINGSEKSVRRGDIISIAGPRTPTNPMGVYGHITLSTDGVVRISTSTFELLFNGNKVEVVGSQLLKGKVCGVCGDYANVKASDLRGPTKCVYSKPELLIASYRVSTEGKVCSSLSGMIASELRRENEECSKIEVLPTKVLGKFGPYVPVAGSSSGMGERIMSSVYGSEESEECMFHRNLIIHEGSKICFSRFPVVGCDASMCRGSEKVMKRISYTCLDNNRAARHIEHRIESGETVSELESMPESFTRHLRLPKTCLRW